MRPICSVEVVRRAEAGAGVPEPVLMQRASTALAGACLDLLRTGRSGVRGARVVALVGSGNNGGDALWALAHLARRGCESRRRRPGAHACRRLGRGRAAGVRVITWDDPEVATVIAAADLILDGVLGIGGRVRFVSRLRQLCAPCADPVSRSSPWMCPAGWNPTPARLRGWP